MRKGIKIATFLLLPAVGVVAWHLLHREPSFQGKTVSQWLQQKADYTGDRRAVTNAFYQIGPSAAPYIAARLRRDYSELGTRYRQSWYRFPRFLQKILPEPRKRINESVAENAFRDIGPSVIPLLTALLGDGNHVVRSMAAGALWRFRHSGQGAAIPIGELIRALEDPCAEVRLYAASALGESGPEGDSAIGPLIARLTDDDKGEEPLSRVYVRATAARSLGRIGPDAQAAVPALWALTKAACPYTRMSADIALWRIQHNVDDVLPRLLRDLSCVEEASKWQVFEALSEMGHAAKSAVPALLPYLKSRNPEIKHQGADTIWTMDPAQATLVVDALVEPMQDQDLATANQYSLTKAATLFGEMGTAAQSAVPLLTKLLQHSYPPARAAAADALDRIKLAAAEEAALKPGNETPGQQDGPANGSQPIRPDSNQTSAAAGSHR